MRVSGPISVQRARPAPGWTAYGPRVVHVVVAEPPPRIAPTLPPQQRGDAACLTLVMAQTYAGEMRRSGRYPAEERDDGPIFALSA
ncbi:MAG: hypothetical protein QM698_13005 [Micropepsaceae bacterium]